MARGIPEALGLAPFLSRPWAMIVLAILIAGAVACGIVGWRITH